MNDPRLRRERHVDEAAVPGSGLGDDWQRNVSDTGEVDARAGAEPPGTIDRLAAEPAAAQRMEPDGPIAAALLSAGIGCASLGMLVVLAEASDDVSDLVSFYDPAGPLSGKTTIATLVWLAAWALLHGQLRERKIDVERAVRWTWILLAVGLLGTFPPFFQLFAGLE
jgi:hypothetical protein